MSAGDGIHVIGQWLISIGLVGFITARWLRHRNDGLLAELRQRDYAEQIVKIWADSELVWEKDGPANRAIRAATCEDRRPVWEFYRNNPHYDPFAKVRAERKERE